MKTLARLFRHARMTTAAGRRIFPAATLKAIETVISDGERLHRAEIRLIIEVSMPVLDIVRHVSARNRAQELFSHYRIWDTEHNSGVLVYLDLADRKVEIIADRAVNQAIAAADWHAVCQIMTHGFARGVFHQSVITALQELTGLLQQHFPADGDRTNQLSNKPLIL